MVNFYNEVLTEHNLNPYHKHHLDGANMALEGVNPSCGDDIVLELVVTDGIIRDGAFEGSGCAISQASADIMLDLIIGHPVEDATALYAAFMRMIGGEATDADMDMLEEAGALADVAHMPARVKCAVLGWRTVNEMLEGSGSAA